MSQASKIEAPPPSAKAKIFPYYLTGFTDAEGCFTIGLYKSNKTKVGWKVKLEFKIRLHKKDCLCAV